MTSSPKIAEFYAFLKFSAHLVILIFKFCEKIVSALLFILDASVPFIYSALSYVPGLCKLISGVIYIVIWGLASIFDFITWITHPMCQILDLSLYFLLSKEQYTQASYYSQIIFSSAAVWSMSLLLIVAGSLIIATEENVPGRNRFRPKTTVPIVCLLAGCIMHFDKVRYDSRMPTVAIFTGALWYCISLAHEDVRTRESARRLGLRATLTTLHQNRLSAEHMNVATAFQQMRNHSRVLRRRRQNNINGELITPSKLTKSMSGTLATEGGLRIIQEDSCPICLVDFVHDEVLRALPCCKHTFHEACVVTWLDAQESCPLCREPLPERSTAKLLVHALFE